MSNKRKLDPTCAAVDCYRRADVEVRYFDDDGTRRGSTWLCRTHAVERAKTFPGRLWRDKACDCGCVDGILHDAGRVAEGEL